MSEPMDAGRALDIRVAVEVLGWQPMYVEPWRSGDIFVHRAPHGEPDALDYYVTGKAHAPCGFSPTTDIADAWLVVEAMREQGWAMGLDMEIHDGAASYEVLFFNGDIWTGLHGSGAATAPLAICRAALKPSLPTAQFRPVLQ